MNTCPACYGTAPDGLLCRICTRNLTTDLRGSDSVMGVAELVDNLHVAQAKQARLSEETGPGGVKHERMPTNIGAMEAGRHLEHILGSWAMDLTGDKWWPVQGRYVAAEAAQQLLDRMDAIRSHGAVRDLYEEVTRAIARGRGIIDVEPFRRFPVGPCPEDGCYRTVFALCPAEGSQRPALMACYQLVKAENRPDLGGGFIHSYTSIQFYRTGARIKRKMEEQRIGGAA